MTVSTWADATATWADPTATWSDTGVIDLNPTFEWSPSTGPGDAPSWEDITELVRSGRISRGRQSEFDRTSAGRLALVVDNRDRTFDPFATNQALINARVRVSVGSGADTVRLFDGWIDSLPQSYDPPNDALVNLIATDGFKLLSRFEMDPIYAGVVEADDPYAWWRLADDLPTATAATDSSGNGRHGTWKGTPSSTQSLLTDGPGGVSLDGSDVNAGSGGDHISADGMVCDALSGGTISAAPLTVEAWVRTGKFGTNLSFICGQTHVVGGTFPTDFVLGMNNSTGTPFFAALYGGGNALATGTTVIRDTGVHHLVGTIDSSRVARLYVDGVLEASHTPAGSGLTIDSSGAFRVGKPPVGSDPGAGSSYKPFKGDICEVALYTRALSGAEILEHYQAGAAPWANDTTGGRIGRVLSLVGWRVADRNLSVGASVLGPARNVAGRSALDHILAVEQTEQGRFFVAGDGQATFRGRNFETTLVSQATFTEDDYVSLEFDFSDANLCNDCTVTREGGTPQRATNADSIDAYWRASDVVNNVLYSSDNEAKAMAEWRVSNYSEPVLRPTGVGFVPYADLPDLFDRVITRELGDRVTITRQLEGDDITVDAAIEGITHEFRPSRDWNVSWNLSPLTFGQFGPGGGSGRRVWTLSGPGSDQEERDLSKLDNNNRLGL